MGLVIRVDYIKYTMIEGYLQCCSDILSMLTIPCCTTINFRKIGKGSDGLLALERYFIEHCQKAINFHLIALDDWKKLLTDRLDYWIYPIFHNKKIQDEICNYKVKYIVENINSLLEDFFYGKVIEAFTLSKEDEEVLKVSFNFQKNENFIFKSGREIFFLQFVITK
jgi:hypothetical protein